MGYRDKPASTSSNPNSVRCVAILDADAGEDVDSVLLAHPDDDVSVARVRATKGLILALRGATRTLSGRDATCATLDREDDDDDDGTGGGCVRIGMATLPGTGALLAVETTADEDALAARLAATAAEHIRFLHGDRWIARLRGERDARDANRRGTEDANGADASDASEQKPSSDDLRSTIESFLFTNTARTAVRIRCTVDPTGTHRPCHRGDGDASVGGARWPRRRAVLRGSQARRRAPSRNVERRAVSSAGVALTRRRHREARGARRVV